LNFIDVATGSLGQGLSCAAGMAYTGKYFDKADYRVFCLIGDGESAEGSIWEAMSFASHYKLDNLVAIFDVNRLGQSEATAFGHNTDVYKQRAEAFGFNTYVIDGHDVEALVKVLHDASLVKGKPTCIIAKTLKGKGIEGVEDLDNWHGKPLGAKSESAVALLQSSLTTKVDVCPSLPTVQVPAVNISNIKLSEPPNYKMGDKVATRQAYGTALLKIGNSNPRVVAVDCDVKNSTFAQTFQKVYPDRFIECFIAEQNMVGVAIGCATRDRTVVFASTFAAFFSRAYDQIRMGAISQTNVNFVGSHAGVSIGEDGPSQMALEDLAMFRAIPGSTVFYPSDAVSCERAVELAANTKGICFIRTNRPATTTIYEADEPFRVGQAKVVRQSNNDQVTVVGAGITLENARAAADLLEGMGVHIRIIDPFTIKPLDAVTIINNAKATGGRIITVEDHYPEGGLGEAVCAAVSEEPNIIVHKVAVTSVPRSGKSNELMDMYGIGSEGIMKAVHKILKMQV
jgi:transketolase